MKWFNFHKIVKTVIKTNGLLESILAYCHVTDGFACLEESEQLLSWSSLTSERIILDYSFFS